ncbi:MAG: tRNA (adenosine(37)-N6)-threonylcarbamoyltransferase complex ATPase subunit type 1 TsaE [Clostridia bacterium]|nr:tRNA (adenosine(37)-N6)-threonylcarbamoyltransferase complex ATPase subunit type 1 TsaE [Clostridia bacterium]MBR3862513.1 tRNA (adenosine(37)-N6)-threonylcarbamoyltransferase complex ATPase subunit type 1 TsaE [Clostridia bacterium]
MLPHKIKTASVQETEDVGAQLADAMLKDPSLAPFVALYGDLGVGKTAFVRGFASVIAPAALVRSPTFALVNEYRGKSKPLFHFDMYRITGEDDLYSIGYDDYLARDGIALVEWSENIPYALPACYLRVEIIKDDQENPDSRMITIEERKSLC